MATSAATPSTAAAAVMSRERDLDDGRADSAHSGRNSAATFSVVAFRRLVNTRMSRTTASAFGYRSDGNFAIIRLSTVTTSFGIAGLIVRGSGGATSW